MVRSGGDKGQVEIWWGYTARRVVDWGEKRRREERAREHGKERDRYGGKQGRKDKESQ
jgi:hypothetical protein